MQISNDSGEQQSVTQCVAISRDAATCDAITAWATGRQWLCQVESDPLLAWTKLLLIEKSKAERTRWGLASPGRTVLLLDDRACDETTTEQLLRAFERYAPTASRITLHDGVLPQTAGGDPNWAAVSPAASHPEDDAAGRNDDDVHDDDDDADDDDDGRLTSEEIRMLLGDDTMEPVS